MKIWEEKWEIWEIREIREEWAPCTQSNNQSLTQCIKSFDPSIRQSTNQFINPPSIESKYISQSMSSIDQFIIQHLSQSTMKSLKQSTKSSIMNRNQSTDNNQYTNRSINQSINQSNHRYIHEDEKEVKIYAGKNMKYEGR